MRSFSTEALYLAFDTSSALGSVAVAKGGEVLASTQLGERGQHAGRLIPAIDRALAEADVDRRAIRGLIVGEGPGSFTGIRVAAATAKGLVYALGCRLWAVSSLVATAIAVGGHGVRYVLFDARSDRVYGGCYGIGRAGVETLVPAHGGNLREVLDGEVPPGTIFVGEGAVRHRAAIVGAGFEVEAGEGTLPTAAALVEYLVLHPDRAPVSLVPEWEPRYIREWKPDAAWKG